LEYLTTEHTHKIYDINDLARSNLNEKLDIEKFNAIQTELEERIEYNKKSIKDLDNNLKETDNYVEKYLPFKLSNLISDILKPITNEKGPFADLIPTRTEMKDKILYDILNDDGESTLDKKGREVKRHTKVLERQDSPDFTSPRKNSETSQDVSPKGQNSVLSLQKVNSEISESETSLEKPSIETRNLNLQSPSRSATTFPTAFKTTFKKSAEDHKFFGRSEELLKVNLL
jgi:hypothetical protein